MKKQILVIMLMVWYGQAQAQSDFDFTQRWFNESLFNPAATGNSLTTGLFLHGRTQWTGLEGAPQTYAMTFDTYIESASSALGLSMFSDRIGYLRKYNARLAYAYYLAMGQTHLLSFGVSAGVVSINSDAHTARADNMNDPLLVGVRGSSPDFDFGIEYKGAVKAGISARHWGTTSITSKYGFNGLNLWAYLSSRFNINSLMSLEPATSFNYQSGIGRYEFGALVYFLKNDAYRSYNDRFWLGAMYRLNSQFSVLAGLHLSKQIRIGYSFDYGAQDLMKISMYGTHELFLAWQFNRIFYKDKLCPAYRNGAVKKK